MKICILGAGAYGIALADLITKNNHEVSLWSYNKEEEKMLKKNKCTPKLKNYVITSNIKITSLLRKATFNSDLIIFAMPASAISTVSKKISRIINKKEHILIASKGIENDTCLFLDEVVKNNINSNKIAVISGPTFAIDIIKSCPIGFTLATNNNQTKNIIKKIFENENVKIRETTDIIGVEICGAIKNVMAIAAGMLSGMKQPDSTKALFLTEALNDIKELIISLDGNEKTILSYAGFGDILMTCSSENSRNFSYGKLIGEGKKIEAEKYAKNTTVEGLYTLKSIKQLITRENLKMPIIDLLSDIICGNKSKEEMLAFLINKK